MQEALGHSDVKTTMIDTHVLGLGRQGFAVRWTRWSPRQITRRRATEKLPLIRAMQRRSGP